MKTKKKNELIEIIDKTGKSEFVEFSEDAILEEYREFQKNTEDMDMVDVVKTVRKFKDTFPEVYERYIEEHENEDFRLIMKVIKLLQEDGDERNLKILQDRLFPNLRDQNQDG